MMRLRAFVLLAAGITGTAALAQSSDTQAILDALKGISTRLDDMQTQIDDLKGSKSTASAAAAVTTTPDSAAPDNDAPAVAGPPPGMVARSGWMVGAIPYTENGLTGPVVGYFRLGSEPFDFAVHQKEMGESRNVYIYRGQAIFNAYEAGNYTFEISFGREGCCVSKRVRLKIDDKDVITFGEESGRGENIYNKSIFGSINMEIGSYNVEFVIAPEDIPRPGLVSIKVMRPDDSKASPFREGELFHYVKASKATAEKQQSDNLNIGDVLTISSNVNVRAAASTTADVTAIAQRGQRAKVVDLVDNGAWVEVELDGRPAGYIKTSALLLNAR